MENPDSQQPDPNFSVNILQQVSLLNSPDCAVVKSAILGLAKLAKNELFKDYVDNIMRCGVVPALVSYLQTPQVVKDDGDGVTKPYQHEVEKGCAFILGLLTKKPEHRQLIIDAGALPCLVELLRRYKISTISRSLVGLLRRVADAINNLAYENIKTLVRTEGGIPPLVELLESNVTKVQRAAAMTLGTLALNNVDNKNQIVECNALPTLVLMLRSEDPTIHYVAVDVIINLVNSSPDIEKKVLLAGALQPVIGLLSSCCSKSQTLAALLLGKFAATDSDCQVHISQRGAIPPLVDMLKSPDEQLQGMSVFALGNLAQDSHIQAGIAHNGGIEPLLNLLDSEYPSYQDDATFVLYDLADNEDIVVDIIKAGGFQKLKDVHFKYYLEATTKERVAITLKRLEEKIQGQVLKHLIYLMCFAEKRIRRNVAIALAYSCSPHDRKTIFIDNNGLELLLDMLESPNAKQKRHASVVLHKMASEAISSVSLFDAAPLSPTNQMYSGEEHVKHAYILFVGEKIDKPRLNSRPWYCPLVRRLVTDLRMFFSTLLVKSHPVDS